MGTGRGERGVCGVRPPPSPFLIPALHPHTCIYGPSYMYIRPPLCEHQDTYLRCAILTVSLLVAPPGTCTKCASTQSDSTSPPAPACEGLPSCPIAPSVAPPVTAAWPPPPVAAAAPALLAAAAASLLPPAAAPWPWSLRPCVSALFHVPCQSKKAIFVSKCKEGLQPG